MGKVLFIFVLWFFIGVVFGSGESNSTTEIPNEFLTKMEELETFREDFKGIKSSFVELSAAFGRFHQFLTKNETSGEPREDYTTKSTSDNPVLNSISSCSDALEILPSPLSKKQTIYPHGNNTSLKVLCDFETDGGGWTIIQKRTSGPKQEFSRTWAEYASGFGLRAGNFWLGLDNIHALTQNGDQELRIDMEDFEGEKNWVKYSNFSVSDASDFYRLSLSGFYRNSTVGDSMVIQNNDGQQFTTKDKNNDLAPYSYCSRDRFGGGWWFPSWCGASNLNGGYFEKGETAPLAKGVLWASFKGFENSLAKTEMKIRKRKSGSA